MNPATKNTRKEVIKALKMHFLHREMVRNYGRIMRNHLNNTRPPISDRKMEASYRRKLLSEDSLTILEILWKESELISTNELTVSGLARSFEEAEITQHGLAVALSGDAKEVTKNISLVRTVAIAGAAYGFVDREERSPTKVVLSGTPKLHELMLKVSDANAPLVLETARELKGGNHD